MKRFFCAALVLACTPGAYAADVPAPTPVRTQSPAEMSAAGAVPSEMLQPVGGPVRFERCSFAIPRPGVLTEIIVLTNTGAKAIRSVDVAYVLYGAAAGTASVAHGFIKGEFLPGAPIAGQAVTSAPGPFTKAYCAASIVVFADGTKWEADAGFLKGATPP